MMPNHAMQRTDGKLGSYLLMKFQPAATRHPPAVADFIDELALLRLPFGLPVYVTAWQSVPFSLGVPCIARPR
jgi:hypothetical protein